MAFDVSHLGTVRVSGPDAFDHLQRSLSNDLRRCTRAGPVHAPARRGRLGGRRHHRVVGRRRALRRHAERLEHRAASSRRIGGTDVTEERAVIAVQGPRRGPGWPRCRPTAAAVHRFCVERFEWEGAPCLVAGTGYTGEDGVECEVPAEVAAGLLGRRPGARASCRPASARATPCGWRRACRCTATSSARGSRRCRPGWAGWWAGTRSPSPGGRPSRRSRPIGPARRLRGLVAEGRQPLRDGADICVEGDQVGVVTSGNFSPMRECGIGLGLVEADAQLLDGDLVTVVQRGRELVATVVRPPLWPIREEETE